MTGQTCDRCDKPMDPEDERQCEECGEVHASASLDSDGMVFLLVCAERGQTKMTPAEAREVARRLLNAAAEAEEAGK